MKNNGDQTKLTVLLTVLFVLFVIIWAALGFLMLDAMKVEAKEIIEVEKPYFIEVQPIPQNVEIEIVNPVIEEDPWLINFTEDERHLLERVVMSEASITSTDCRFAVAATVVNRVLSDKFPNTITEVVYQPNAFSTADNGEPTEEIKMVVDWALKYRPFPTNMVYFRADHYHEFGTELFSVDNMYFSGE